MNSAIRRTIDVVVPTWNEEGWLPGLLSRLTNSPHVNGIVVADNDSSDRSVEIARAYGCKVVKGGPPGIARNAGAQHTTSNIILFLDADVMCDDFAFERIALAFADPQVAAVHPLLVPLSEDPFVKLSYRIMDRYFRLTRRIGVAQGIGSVIGVRRDAFFMAQGFNEGLTVGEDAEFFRRICKFGNVIYDRSNIVHVSARRFSVENKVLFAGKCALWAGLRFFGYLNCPWGYKWSGYPKRLAHLDMTLYSRRGDSGGAAKWPIQH